MTTVNDYIESIRQSLDEIESDVDGQEPDARLIDALRRLDGDAARCSGLIERELEAR